MPSCGVSPTKHFVLLARRQHTTTVSMMLRQKIQTTHTNSTRPPSIHSWSRQPGKPTSQASNVPLCTWFTKHADAGGGCYKTRLAREEDGKIVEISERAFQMLNKIPTKGLKRKPAPQFTFRTSAPIPLQFNQYTLYFHHPLAAV